MRIKIIIYVVFFTCLSLIFIMNIETKSPVNLVFTKVNVSTILISLVSIFLGFVLGGIFFSRKKRRIKKENKEVKRTDEIKNER